MRPAIFKDGQLDVPGLHDAKIVSISLEEAGDLRMTFRAETGDHISLRFAAATNPHVWSGAVLLPNIVHSAWFSDDPISLAWLSGLLTDDEAERCLRERDVYAPGGWLVAFSNLYGGGLVVFGRKKSGIERIEIG